MKKLKMVTVAIAASLAGAAFAEDLVLTGAYPVTVASGVTTTISDKITGTGPLVVLGGGTVVLNNGDNDFTGGIIVSNGIVRADAAGSLGSGPITLEGDATLRQVQFNANNATFSNSITLKDKTTSFDYPAVQALQSVTLKGTLTIDPDTPNMNLCYFHVMSGASGNTAPTVTIDGPVDIPDGRFTLNSFGKFKVNGKMTVKNLYYGGAFAQNGMISVSNPSNSIYYIQLYAADVSCLATNVMRNSVIEFAYNVAWGANGHGWLLLNGHDQQFSYITSKDNALAPTAGTCLISTGAQQPATITINAHGRGGASSTTANMQVAVRGPISFVVEREPDVTGGLWQGIARRQHQGAGHIEVRNGGFRCVNGATMPNITNITLRSGTSFYVQNVTNAFEKLEVIRIEGTGRFYTESGCLEPVNCPHTDLIMDEDSFFQVRKDTTNTVDHLIIGGKEVKAGTYTYETLPQMRYASNPTYFSGVLIVRRHHRSMVVKIR